MRVFVSGATGTVGREVCRTLREEGHDVRVGARASSDVASVVPDVDDVVPLDYVERTVDSAIFSGIDAFFFMTPLLANQVAASRAVLEAAMQAGVPHVVRLSSRSVGWDETSILRAWHRDIEQQVMRSALSWTILRPCSFFQNFITHQGAAVRDMSAIILPQGNGLISYVDAADVGEVAAACLVDPKAHARQTYVLTGGRAYGGKGVAAEIGRALGRPITYIHVEPEQFEAVMRERLMPPWLIESALAVFAHAREGEEAAVDPATSRLLGRPATTLSDFVDRNRAAWS